MSMVKLKVNGYFFYGSVDDDVVDDVVVVFDVDVVVVANLRLTCGFSLGF